VDVSTGAAPSPRSRRRPGRLVSAAVLVHVVILAAGGYLVWGATVDRQPTSAPSCSWPLQVRGHATREQAGLIRCYLRALAHHDARGLRALTNSARPIAGTASATFTLMENDYIFAVRIVFADHSTETVGIALAGDSPHSWRLGIGKVMQRSGGPPPAKPSPG
jgi:hypothetical protein